MKAPLLCLLLTAGFLFGCEEAVSRPPQVLYASVAMTKAQKNSSTPADSGLYRRTAAGTWSHFGPRILGIMGLAVHPQDRAIMLIASSDGVVRSRDAGLTWRKTTGWEVADVRSVAFDPRRPELAYAVTAWGPLRSTDAGATWQLAQAGLPRLFAQTLLTSPKISGRVLIGTEVGLYRSLDAAQTWQRAEFPEIPVLRLAQGAAGRVLLAGTQGLGAYCSRDGGDTWGPVDPATATANLYAVAVAPQNPDLLAIGGWGTGVRTSVDGGKTWHDRNTTLPNRNIFVLAYDPDVPGRLWASTFEEGTFLTDDFGLTWRSGGLDGAYGFDYNFISDQGP